MADSVFIGENVLNETLKNLDRYDIISVKQQSTTTNDKKSIWTYKILDWMRKIVNHFLYSCFFLISKKKFNELGGFDETLQNSEDFWLSKKRYQNQNSKYSMSILDKITEDFEIWIFKFLKINLFNYFNYKNIKWFKKDLGYWGEYDGKLINLFGGTV